jgi:uncharacterized protein YukE
MTQEIKDEEFQVEIDLDKELEDYNELLKRCNITINKIKKRRKDATREASIYKQE